MGSLTYTAFEMRRISARGFTLLEVLVAMCVLVIIAGIVYASFYGVTDATEIARASQEKLRLERFLRKNIVTLLSSVYCDPACAHPDYYLSGTDGTGPDGAMDALDFCSSAPMIGGMSLPGALKRVQIAIGGSDASDQTLGNLDATIASADGSEEQPLLLQVTETPLVITSGMDMNAPDDTENPAKSKDKKKAADKQDDVADTNGDYEPVSWSVPVQSLDISYFDGEDWVKEWDSIGMARLPWALCIKVNFARTEDEMQQDKTEGLDVEENPDLELVVTVPLGSGTVSEFIQEEAAPGFRDRQGDTRPGGQQDGKPKPQGSGGSNSRPPGPQSGGMPKPRGAGL